MTEEYQSKKVIVLGPTGSGKSTLLNLLIGKEITKDPTGDRLICKDEYFKTSSKQRSESKDFNEFKVTLDYPSDTSINFIDSPGLLDTELIDRAYNLLKTYEYISNKNCIVVFVLEVANAQSIKGDSFIKTLMFIKQIFADLPSIAESSFLVITKYNHKTDETADILNQITDAIEERSQDEDQKQDLLGLVEFIQKIKNNVLTFSKIPKKVSEKNRETHIIEKDSIIKTICKLRELQIATNFLKTFKLDSETLVKVQQDLPKKFKELKDPIDEKIVQYLTQTIILGRDDWSYSQKIEHLKKMDNYSEKISEKQTQYKELLSKLRTNFLITDDEMEQILSRYERLQVFSTFLTDEIIARSFPINGLQRLYQIQEEWDQEHGLLLLSGYFIQSTQLQGILNSHQQAIKIAVIKVDYFIVDCNLLSNGITLIIKCAEFLISKQANFNLSGCNGEVILPCKAYQDHGKPGNPGYSGGYFILITERISARNSNIRLDVDVSGGQGGDGQNGSDGKNGKNGEDADLKEIFKRDKDLMIQAEEITSFVKDLVSYNRQYQLTYEKVGEPGEKGEAAYRGGAKGINGYEGLVIVDTLNTNNLQLINKISGNNLSAKEGNHGRPGQGGRYGKIAYGVYQDEYIFPLIRGKVRELGKKEKSAVDGSMIAPIVINGTAVVCSKIIQSSFAIRESEQMLQGLVTIGEETGKEIFENSQLVKETIVQGIQGTKKPVTNTLIKGLAIGLFLAQFVGSVTSACYGNEFIEGPKLRESIDQASDGDIPTEVNSQDQSYPQKRLITICLNDPAICCLLSINVEDSTF